MQTLDKYEINIVLKKDTGTKSEEEILGFSPIQDKKESELSTAIANDTKGKSNSDGTSANPSTDIETEPITPEDGETTKTKPTAPLTSSEKINPITQPTQPTTFEILPVPKHVFAFWFGNPMKGARLEAYNSFVNNIGVPVILIGENNLRDYNVIDHPLHKVVDLEFGKGLSMNHLVDYLRVYFMHFHGGGYHDIKHHRISWEPHFAAMGNTSIWAYGIAEGDGGVGCDESYMVGNSRCTPKESELYGREKLKGIQGDCCQVVKDGWPHLISNGAYICRPKTPLTTKWLSLVESHLDAKYDELVANPAPTARCCSGDYDTQKYPFRWAEIHGEAFHPMQFEFQEHIKGGLPRWRTRPYHDASEGRFLFQTKK